MSVLDQLEELVTGAGRGQEDSGEGRCCGKGVGLLHPPDLHTGMVRLYHHGNTQRMKCVLEAVSDLHRQTLLDLQAACECINYACNLAESGDLSVRDVGDVALADEREHMVLAGTVQLDILDYYHLLVFLLEHRALNNLRAVLRISLCEELKGLRHALRRLDQAFALRVLPYQAQYLFYVRCNLLCCLSIIFFFLIIWHIICIIFNKSKQINLQLRFFLYICREN